MLLDWWILREFQCEEIPEKKKEEAVAFYKKNKNYQQAAKKFQGMGQDEESC